MRLELVFKEIFIEDSERGLYGITSSDNISLYVNGEFISLEKCIKLKSNESIEYESEAEFLGYGGSAFRRMYCELDIENFEIERFILVFANLSLNGKIYECDCLYNYMYKTDDDIIALNFDYKVSNTNLALS